MVGFGLLAEKVEFKSYEDNVPRISLHGGVIGAL